MKFKFLLCTALIATAVTGCKSTEEKEADLALLSTCNLNTYKNYQEIVANNPQKLAKLTPQYTYFKGSSLLPFGSRDSAVDEATLYVCKKNFKNALAIVDREKTYSAQERAIGGVYHIYNLMPFALTDITEQELASQLEIWLPSSDAKFAEKHREYLLNIAKDQKFSKLSPTFEKLIKSVESHSFKGINPGYRTMMMDMSWKKHLKLHQELVDIYVLYNGESAEKKLVAWVKYHKLSSIKLAAYKALIDLEKHERVEDLLTKESDTGLKKQVGMLLI
ncbi:hypothetical protein PESP_a1195 [Pseudoalteromonas espejiana DSM 9414]|uniref:Lipoprotein n=1 Tax=Pseudoalteromonas espejiana TaxID=28107 RepID=A0A510Y039_9GAMM|nr:hypothetical protein [Pseudoalteromonas espejiana]ASM49344.1 hypothetical protein PESP_a1195 [Pseudoalteromonas espejiana DSM 9414]GEK56077.1 hypothetical protein PES01_29220 [Pseudoalteromonas espejiana]